MCFEHIYLDHNANAPMYPDVIEAMRPYFLNAGNTESRHSFGRAARHAWESAKETVARILGADPVEVVFTAGGTEANSLAILGLAHLELLPAHIVSSSIEHPAVTDPIASLEATGFTVEHAPVSKQGLTDVSQLVSMLRPETRFVTMMLANNETGAIQPVRQLAVTAAERNIPVHTDAVQAVGRIPVNFHDLGVTTLAASAHKFHGPPGIGLLLVKSGVRLDSWRFHGNRKAPLFRHSGSSIGCGPSRCFGKII